MNIGLVLSGGMAKGAYQIGVLRALDDFIPLKEIKYMSCASIGVLNGYAYATRKLNVAEQMWKNLCNNDARFIINQILKSSVLQQNICKIYEKQDNFSNVFYCSLLDLYNRNIIYKDLSSVDSKKIPLYLKASVAMPIYNKQVRLDNTAYFDGAMIDNIPVYPLLKHNLDYIICIYFDDICYKFENSNFDNKIIKITFPSQSILRQSVMFNHDSIEKMIEGGYERTKQVLKFIFSEGYQNKQSIYEKIDYINQNSSSGSLRITGDMMVTNLNRVTQKLLKRKIL